MQVERGVWKVSSFCQAHLKATKQFWQRKASHLLQDSMLMALTGHISLHLFELLSQLPSFDPYPNPMRQVEEVMNTALYRSPQRVGRCV